MFITKMKVGLFWPSKMYKKGKLKDEITSKSIATRLRSRSRLKKYTLKEKATNKNKVRFPFDSKNLSSV